MILMIISLTWKSMRPLLLVMHRCITNKLISANGSISRNKLKITSSLTRMPWARKPPLKYIPLIPIFSAALTIRMDSQKYIRVKIFRLSVWFKTRIVLLKMRLDETIFEKKRFRTIQELLIAISLIVFSYIY